MRQGAGREHLAAIARSPRAPGSEGERAARDHAAAVLRDAGFTVAMERFEYSSLPGRFGTPACGALAMATVLLSAWLGLGTGSPRSAATALGLGLALLGLAVRRMLGEGVLTVPWLRAEGVNLVAARGAGEPRVWLVAHLDSKSQPVPSALRVAGVAALSLGVVLALVAVALQLGGLPHRTLWWASAMLATLGGLPVASSVVGNNSRGAVDNASGAAAVLQAAQSMSADAAVGILLPSAEELGLAGARAWVRARRGATGMAINCDGVDDDGELTIMYSGRRPDTMIAALERHAGGRGRVRRMPLGLLTDSVAFADAGWETVTVSHGSMRTLARVHSRRDTLDALRGEAIGPVATLLARTAEELAR